LERTYDKEKILECMFDPQTSEILAELEQGVKDSQYLINKLQISEDVIKEKLSYLLEHEFVTVSIDDDKTVYFADAEKLAKMVEGDKNFQGVVDGLTELDSYLN
jgi:hypothetical protein